MLSVIMLAGSLFNSSFQKEMSVTICREVEVKKACKVSVEATGFGSKNFIVYSRLATGELEPLESSRLDVAGKGKVSIRFTEPGAASVVLVLFDREKPVAMDGADILVIPDKSQLGEQVKMIYPTPPYTDGEYIPDEDVHN